MCESNKSSSKKRRYALSYVGLFVSFYAVAKGNTIDVKGIRLFGNRLRAVRIEKGLTIEQLANQLDLSTSQVGRIERGEINTSISFVFLFAKALKVHPTELFQFDYK